MPVSFAFDAVDTHNIQIMISKFILFLKIERACRTPKDGMTVFKVVVFLEHVAHYVIADYRHSLLGGTKLITAPLLQPPTPFGFVFPFDSGDAFVKAVVVVAFVLTVAAVHMQLRVLLLHMLPNFKRPIKHFCAIWRDTFYFLCIHMTFAHVLDLFLQIWKLHAARFACIVKFCLSSKVANVRVLGQKRMFFSLVTYLLFV